MSQRCGVDPRNVHAYVIGEHGDSEVLLWTSQDRVQIYETVRRSAYHIIEAKGFTNYGVSLAVLRIVEAILRDEHSVLTVYTWLNGQYGIRVICLSVPCTICSRGIERVVETSLAPEEHEALKRSAEILKSTREELSI